ncbi:MAG: RrF2 family transcriptional regulator [Gemmataceae bacterium]
MKISAKAEYACVAMIELAITHGEREVVQIKTIAEAHDISPRFLVQILLQLKSAGLVTSTRGSSGGYQLARPPESISLADIIMAIDRPALESSSFATLPNGREVEVLRAVWVELNRLEVELLRNTTLADLILRAQGDDAGYYQI